MKELKLDLLPGNLYAARRKAEQQKEKEKKTKKCDRIMRQKICTFI